MQKVIKFIRKDVTLSVSVILAVVSAFFVPPDMMYISYIDYRTLGLLFSLMIIMAGFQSEGIFRRIGHGLLNRFQSNAAILVVLIMLCFFFSMLITNDVALITFVPFAIEVLAMSKREKLIIPVVVLQTIAANLGSMLTPIGNPQNLYLYSLSEMTFFEFIKVMLPYTAVSLFLILISILGVLIWKRKKCDTLASDIKEFGNLKEFNFKKRRVVVYTLLFILSLLSVVRIIPWPILVCIVILVIIMINIKLFKKVDYVLLITFVMFFIFVGNVARIPAISVMLEKIIDGNEVLTSILLSQVISNVPAALLLSGFTTEYANLLVGLNVGGLGTLIASMASLISFKQISKRYSNLRGKYFIVFTLFNIAFLIVLCCVYKVLHF